MPNLKSMASDLLSSSLSTTQSRLLNKSAARRLDTSSEPSELTKDGVDVDFDVDKATPSSEEGDDDDGPVMPNGDTLAHPPDTKGFSARCARTLDL
jgi:hypothetical protein